MKHISSPNNAVIRHVEQLQRKSKARKKEGLFIIEGQREILLATRGKFIIDQILVCGPILLDTSTFTAQDVYSKLEIHQSPEIISVTQEVYEKMAYRSGTEGCIAFAKARSQQLNDLELTDAPLILIAESTEKPGNLGALLRTADAAKVDAVIIANPTADLYNPNVIRSSVGCLFTIPTAVCSTEELIGFLNDKNIDLYAATLQSSERYDRIDYRNASAIAVGT